MKAALYESDITPPLGCYLNGYGYDRRAEDVYNKLYSKALVIEQEGETAVIIAVDICEYPEEMHDLVTQRIFEYTGITKDKICITSTHTHYGAPVTDNPNINCFGDAAYKDVFYRLVADSAILAYKRLSESKLLFGSIEVPGIANCRCTVLKDGTLATFIRDPKIIESPMSEPDHELPILFVEQDGKKVGALYAFGCHQDTVGRQPYGYSGDYSSVAAEKLKEKYGKDFVSIYVPAPSGDINHINPFADPTEKRNRYREIGAKLAEGIDTAEKNALCIDGKLCVQKEPMRIKRRKYDEQQFKSMVIKYASDWGRLGNLVYYQRADKAEHSDLYVQLLAIGELAIYIYPGEMFSQYSHRTKKASPFKYNIVIENSNAYGGYIPTPDAFEENSNLYEIAPAYDSNLVPEAGEMLFEKIMNMADTMHNQ